MNKTKEEEELLLERVSNDTLMYITAAYFFINIASYLHMTSMNGGGSIIYIFFLPFFWLATFIGVSAFAYNKRKILFEKSRKKISIVLMICCTPFPYILLGQIIRLLLGEY